MSYSEVSIKLTKEISKFDKKNNGIFFTPKSIIKKGLESYNTLNINSSNQKIEVLEPSCGSCEFINKLADNDKYNIIGIENNKQIYDEIVNFNSSNVKIINADFLNVEFNKKFDLIIGNPPYFVINKSRIDKKYYDFFEGRPNIYIIFIIKSLELLSLNGSLIFVIPKNFTNCMYYNNLRTYINNNYKIINIIDCEEDEYIDTQQVTMILHLQNVEDKSNLDEFNNKFVYDIGGYLIFNTIENINKIKNLYVNSTSLSNIGFDVHVGKVIWNQVKELLTDNNLKPQLIYSSDIENGELIINEYSNEDKKNYIDRDEGKITGPLLVLNRGYGKGKYKLNYCLINMDKPYFIENHLICIVSKEKSDNIIERYNSIINSLNNPKTSEFINIYFGNSAINTTELKYILPIYL